MEHFVTGRRPKQAKGKYTRDLEKQALHLKTPAELLVMVGWVEQLRFEKGFLKIAKNLILEDSGGHFLFSQQSAKEYKQTLRKEKDKNV